MKKTKHQTTLDFLDSLQREYFLCFLRSKIYYGNDVFYYKKVMHFKKEKIIDLSDKHGLINIFNNTELYEEYRKSYFQQFGIPKDIGLNDLDKKLYFKLEDDVFFLYNSVKCYGKIKIIQEKYIKIKKRGSEDLISINTEGIRKIF